MVLVVYVLAGCIGVWSFNGLVDLKNVHMFLAIIKNRVRNNWTCWDSRSTLLE